MNDDRTIDERIGDAARELYREPPSTPRAEMWAEIEARLDAERGAAGRSDPDGATPVTPLPVRERRTGSRLSPTPGRRWWIGIAAALVIGLGIGRWTSDPAGDAVRVAENSGDPAAEVATDPRTVTERPATADERDDSLTADASDATEAPATERDERAASPGAGSAYAVATRAHLARSETFLAGVRADLEQGEATPDLGPWARSLLGRTRLLLASPAGQDPQTRRLLQDLELMLAQVSLSAASDDPAEARIVDEGLEDGDLMYRLRSATEQPAGPGTSPGVRTSSL